MSQPREIVGRIECSMVGSLLESARGITEALEERIADHVADCCECGLSCREVRELLSDPSASCGAVQRLKIQVHLWDCDGCAALAGHLQDDRLAAAGDAALIVN